MLTAIYPGRFDPVTNGHIDITLRAASMFERVVVAIYDLDANKSLFSTDERVKLFREAVKQTPHVEVKSFTGLVVDFARKENAKVLVRGIRAVTDFEAELDMALMNKKMAPEIESVYLMASLDQMFISASRIRELAALGRDVADLVPQHVADALHEKIER